MNFGEFWWILVNFGKFWWFWWILLIFLNFGDFLEIPTSTDSLLTLYWLLLTLYRLSIDSLLTLTDSLLTLYWLLLTLYWLLLTLYWLLLTLYWLLLILCWLSTDFLLDCPDLLCVWTIENSWEHSNEQLRIAGNIQSYMSDGLGDLSQSGAKNQIPNSITMLFMSQKTKRTMFKLVFPAEVNPPTVSAWQTRILFSRLRNTEYWTQRGII